MPDVWIRIGEAAKLLGISPWTLRKWAEEWGFTVIRRSPSGNRYFKLREILEVGGDHVFKDFKDLASEKEKSRRRAAIERFRKEIEERRRRSRVVRLYPR